MLDTPANRALVNRGIAEARGDKVVAVDREGAIAVIGETDYTDYTRSLDACYDVCEAKGIRFASILAVVGIMANENDDLRWLVAQEVWEEVKAGRL